jgi:hypothetical protein
MRILTCLFGDRNSDAFAESWRKTYFGWYEKSVKKYPLAPSIVHLHNMWTWHFDCKPSTRHLNKDDVVVGVICSHACLEPPRAASALTRAMLGIEHPQFAEHEKYKLEYMSEVCGILQLVEARNWIELNRLFDSNNPGSLCRSPYPLNGDAYEVIRQIESMMP